MQRNPHSKGLTPSPHHDTIVLAAEQFGEYGRKKDFVMPNKARQIKYVVTGAEFGSMYRAGQALAGLVGGDPKDSRVWFKIQRAYPDRFLTKDPTTGDWVPLKAAPRKPRAKKDKPIDVAKPTEVAAPAAAPEIAPAPAQTMPAAPMTTATATKVARPINVSPASKKSTVKKGAPAKKARSTGRTRS
jgi:hypothetical protein